MGKGEGWGGGRGTGLGVAGSRGIQARRGGGVKYIWYLLFLKD